MFTTFLLGTAIATVLVLAGLLLARRPDAPMRVPIGPIAVVAASAALTALGFFLI